MTRRLSISQYAKQLRWLACASLLLDPTSSPGQESVAWRTVPVTTTASFRGLSVVDDRVAWASGSRGTVIRTTDGGATWLVDSIPNASAMDLRGIHGRSALVAHVAATAGRIWRTVDGGQSWSLRYQSADTTMFLDAIVFADDRTGYALGDPQDGRFVMLVTRNGGETWSDAPASARPVAADGEAAFAASGTSLVVSGARHAWLGTGGTVARVYRSSDALTSWISVPSPLPARAGAGGVFSVAFADTLIGVIVGGDYERPDSSRATGAYTVDGGRTWTPATPPPRGYRSGVALWRRGGQTVAIAVGTNGTDISHDGGRSWSPLDGTPFNSVAFAPSGAAIAVGGRGRVARLDPRTP
jgi:photosystem II stability/assembly factor-like uncharacterized protein